MDYAYLDFHRKRTAFLDVDIEGTQKLGMDCQNICNLKMSLSDLESLSQFLTVEKLLITGGVLTVLGLTALYGCKMLTTLILDYEETDSDVEGIELKQFPNLTYVRTRSDLNVHNIDLYLLEDKIEIEICNEYRGKRRKIRLPASSPILPDFHTIFFSVEAETPASMLLMDILRPLELEIDAVLMPEQLSDKLSSVAIIPICMSQQLLQQGYGKERILVSQKQGRAEIRLQIDFAAFVFADSQQRRAMCKCNILQALEILRKKDNTFRGENLRTVIERFFE